MLPRRWWAPTLIVGLALLARAVVVVTMAPAQPTSWESEEIVENLLAGRGFTYEQLGTTYRAAKPPLYEAICAVVYWMTGHNQHAMLVVESLWGAAAAAISWWLAAQLFGWRAGWLAGVGVALHPALVYYDTHQLHPLSLAVMLVLAVVAAFFWCGSRMRAWPRLMLVGALIGLAAHERGTAALLVPLGIVWLGWVFRARGWPILRVAVPLLLGFLVLITPWTIRNYLVLDRWVFMTSTSGMLLWRGNNPHASGAAVDETLTPILRTAEPAFQRRLTSLDELGQRDLFLHEARSFIRTHPLEFLRLTARKLVYFWWFAPMSGYRYPAAYRTVYQGYYAMVLFLSLWGFGAGWRNADQRQRERLVLLVGVMATFSLGQALYYVETRHRWVIEPLLLVLASGVLSAWWRTAQVAISARSPLARNMAT